MNGLELAIALKKLPGMEFLITLSSAEDELPNSGIDYFDFVYPKPLNGPNLTQLLKSERVLEYFSKDQKSNYENESIENFNLNIDDNKDKNQN